MITLRSLSRCGVLPCRRFCDRVLRPGQLKNRKISHRNSAWRDCVSMRRPAVGNFARRSCVFLSSARPFSSTEGVAFWRRLEHACVLARELGERCSLSRRPIRPGSGPISRGLARRAKLPYVRRPLLEVRVLGPASCDDAERSARKILHWRGG